MDKRFVIEKDYIDAKTGKRCLIVFNVMGVRCAYVEVDKHIPLSVYYEKLDLNTEEKDAIIETAKVLASRRKYAFTEADVSVHGGITFADKLYYTNSNTKFVGIDFAHYADARDLKSYKKYFGASGELYKTIERLNINQEFGRVYTLEDVQAELDVLVQEVFKYEQRELRRLRKAKAYKWKHRETKNKQNIKYRR